MKSKLILLYIFFLLKEIKYSNNKKTNSKIKEKEEENDIKELENKEKKSDAVMNDDSFDKKIIKIIEEKKIKKDKKINKDKLKKIFDEIYGNEFNLPYLPRGELSDTDTDSNEESKNFKDEVFEKAARGLDYDDEISINQIKDWIGPNRIKVALNELIENLVGMVDDMGKMAEL